MSDDQVQQIKERIDIVEFVNQYVPLKRSGLNHKGLCPFHKERTPSFMVNPERQIFKCFGCDESGDVLTFVQKMEGLTFPEALELLADRVGIKLDRRKAPEQYKQEKDEKTTLYRLNAAAAKFFHHLLLNHPSGKAALDYLHGRSVRDDTIKQFQLGYAPSKSILGQWLAKYGFTSNDLRKAGSPERFSNRIMFPLRDTLGNVVGFTGRLLDKSAVSSQQSAAPTHSTPRPGSSLRVGADAPKYYNTPETPIFKKSTLVYGLAEGKQEIRTRNAAILVEGQMDVILSHQAGVRVAVASSGTALTLDHLKAIRRYTGNVLIAFDADEAGVNATKKTIGLTFDAELTPKIVVMPSGCKDAGEAIQKDPKLWAEALKNAQPAIDWLISSEIGSAGAPLDGAKKKTVAKVVLPILVRVQDPVERAHYVGQLANKLHIPEQSLLDALSRTKQRRSTPQPSATPVTPGKPSTQTRPLGDRLAGLVALHPNVLDAVTITTEQFPEGSFAHRLFSAVKTWYDTHDRQVVANSFNSIRSNFHPAQQAQLDLLALEMQELLADHDPAEMAQEFVVRLRRDSNESLKASIAEAMREAEAKGDRAAVKKLMTELQGALRS